MGLKHQIFNSHNTQAKTTNEIYCIKIKINQTLFINIGKSFNMKKSIKNSKVKYKRWKVHKAHKLRKYVNRSSSLKQTSSPIESNRLMLEDQILMQGLNNSIKIISKDDKIPLETDTILSQLGSFNDHTYLSNPISKNNDQIISLSHTKINTPIPVYTVIYKYTKSLPPPLIKRDDKKNYFKYENLFCIKTTNESEYDMDEDDYAWLDLINKQYSACISERSFEFLIDRIEKKAFIIQNQDKFDVKKNTLGKNLKFAKISPSKHVITENDEDAVCCICNDGECSNSNVILFCDACNIPVHQECYGVPYIPEGQWLCRVCLQEPSTTPAHVNCVLCPNRGGAYKRVHDTSNTNLNLHPEGLKDDMPEIILNPSAICLWSHVVCALWIPEVSFGNMVFLEPVDNVERIPAARWRLTCYICRQRNVGACIQCHKSNCYTAFHVTCAQQAGLYMVLETTTTNHTESRSSPNTHKQQHSGPMSPLTIKKIAYCDLHLPPNLSPEDWAKSWSTKSFLSSPQHHHSPKKVSPNTNSNNNSLNLIKRARKVLAERRLKKPTAPIVVLPEIPDEILTTLCRMEWPASTLSPSAKQTFLRHLLGYWKLKRQARNGFPLIKRLQSQMHGPNLATTLQELIECERERDHEADLSSTSPQFPCKRPKLNSERLQGELGHRSNITKPGHVGSSDLLKPWLKLRQDLEKARLLVELIQKREKIKKEQISLSQRLTEQRLVPLTTFLRGLLTYLEGVDTDKIFSRPVSLKEVPDYLSFIKAPMDFATMRKKLEMNEYDTFHDFITDFHLIISNCKTYNPPESVYYEAAILMERETKQVLCEAAEVLLHTTNDVSTREGEELCTRVAPTITQDQFGKVVEAEKNDQKSRLPSSAPASRRRQDIHELEAEIADIKAQLREAKHDSSMNRCCADTRGLRTSLLHKQSALHHEKKRLARLAPSRTSTPHPPSHHPLAPKRQSSRNRKPMNKMSTPPHTKSSLSHCESRLSLRDEESIRDRFNEVSTELLHPDKILVTFPLCYYKNVLNREPTNSYSSNTLYTSTPSPMVSSPYDTLKQDLQHGCLQSNQRSQNVSSARLSPDSAEEDSIESIVNMGNVKLRVTVVNPVEGHTNSGEDHNSLQDAKSMDINKTISQLNHQKALKSHINEFNASKERSILVNSNLGEKVDELTHYNGRDERLSTHDIIACPVTPKDFSKPFLALENGLKAFDQQTTSFRPEHSLFGMGHLESFTLDTNQGLLNDKQLAETPLNRESFKIYRNDDDDDQALCPDDEDVTVQNGDGPSHEDLTESWSSCGSVSNHELGNDEGEEVGNLPPTSSRQKRHAAIEKTLHTSSPLHTLCVKNNGLLRD